MFEIDWKLNPIEAGNGRLNKQSYPIFWIETFIQAGPSVICGVLEITKQ